MTDEEIKKELKRISNTQERILKFLHSIAGNIPQEWGEYEVVCKILNRSKDWYKAKRNSKHPELIKGEDWRMVGGKIEYKLSSIERLKESEIKKSSLKVA